MTYVGSVEAGHDRVQARGVGGGSRDRRRGRQRSHQDPHPSQHGAACYPEIGTVSVMAATAIESRVESLVGDLGAVRAPRGTERECKGWHQEAALRMLCNNLDPEVAEDPQRLVVYGGSGRAARSHEALKAIVAALLELEDDETLLVQSGSPWPSSAPTPAPRACFSPTRSSCPGSPPGTSSAGSRPRGSRCSGR